MMMLILAAAVFDPTTFLVEQATGLGGDLTGVLIKAVGAGASLYVAKVGVKKIRERVTDTRQVSLPRPVGTRAGFQAVSRTDRVLRPQSPGQVWTQGMQISSKARAARLGGYRTPAEAGLGSGTWDDWERRERSDAARRIRATRDYRRKARAAGHVDYQRKRG